MICFYSLLDCPSQFLMQTLKELPTSIKVKSEYLAKHENAATQLGLSQYYELHSHLQIFLYFFNNVLTSQKEGSQAKVIKRALALVPYFLNKMEWMDALLFKKKKRFIPQSRHGEFEPGKAQYSTPNFFDRFFLV